MTESTIATPTDAPQFLAPGAMLRQDWDSLAADLANSGFRMDRDTPPRQFAAGFGNINFLLRLDGAPVVLRRPPEGPIPPGANDMSREFRILNVLWQALPLAPRGLYFSADAGVIGAPFLIMEYRPGLVIRGILPAHLEGDTNAAAGLGRMLVDTLARLHSVDAAEIGLDGLGRPEGFLTRTVAGWKKRASIAVDGETPPRLAELLAWLDRQEPTEGAPALLHSDYKLDHIVLDPASLESTAILDWDMGTRGDPLLDLATLLSYWPEPGDPAAMHEIGIMPTAKPGFPTRAEAAARYAGITGRDLSGFRFHRVLAMVKLAVVFLQLHARYMRGGTGDPRFEHFGDIALGLLDFTETVAAGDVF